MPIEATIIRWGLLSVPALALVVAPSFPYPFITPKVFLFRGLIEVLFITLLVGILRGRIRIGRDLFRAPVLSYLVLVLVLCLAVIVGVNIARSIWGTLERMEGLFQVLHYAGFLLLLVVVFRTEGDWLRFFRISLGVSIGVCLYAFWEKAHPPESVPSGAMFLVSSTLGNSGYLGGYLLLHFFLALLLVMRARPQARFLYAGIALLDVWVLVLSGSRAGLLGLAVGLVVWGILGMIRSRDRRTKRIGWGGIGLALAALVFWGLQGLTREAVQTPTKDLLQRLSTLTDFSTLERIRVWRIALKGFLERPVLGWGPNNFVEVYERFFVPPTLPGNDWYDSAHNVLLDLGVSAGFMGIAVFLATLGVVIWAYVHRKAVMPRPTRKSSPNDGRGRERPWALVGLVVGYLVHLIFNFPVLVLQILFLAVVGYANFSVLRNSASSAGHVPAESFTPGLFFKVGAIILIAVISMSMYFYTVQPALAVQAFMEAASSQSTDLRDPATLAHIRRALVIPSFATRELRLFLVDRINKVAESPQVSPEAKRRVLEFSANELREQLEADPDDPHVLWELANLCNMLSPFDPSKLDEAEKRWTQAIVYSPKRPQLYLGLGTTMALAGRLEETGNLFKQAVILGPNWIEPRIRLLIYYLVRRDDRRAEVEARRLGELISAQRGARGFTEDEALRLSSVYQQVGKVEKAQEIWNKREKL